MGSRAHWTASVRIDPAVRQAAAGKLLVLRAISSMVLRIAGETVSGMGGLFAGLGYPANRENFKNAARRGRLELGTLARPFGGRSGSSREALLRGLPDHRSRTLGSAGFASRDPDRRGTRGGRARRSPAIRWCRVAYGHMHKRHQGGDGGKNPSIRQTA